MVESLEGVSKTALGVARIRAGESRRDDHLFVDDLASAFVASAPEAYAEEAARPGERSDAGARIARHVVVRTRFYDDYLLTARGDGIRQVVLLAAGLDARAFRLAWPAGTTVYELDLPEVCRFKEDVVQRHSATPTCRRVVVPLDLRIDWSGPLRDAGFEPGRPTAWLVEGLLVYLEADEAAALMRTVAELSATGSRVACERGNAATALAALDATNRAAAMWRGGLGPDAATWLSDDGWQTQTFELAALAAEYGRPVASETNSGFVVATR